MLLKRRALIDKGFAPGNLLITVVRKPDGEGHAVLTVRTDRGDFILDNLNEDVLNWEATEYRYLKRQSSQHSGRWVTIESRQDVLVGSVDLLPPPPSHVWLSKNCPGLPGYAQIKASWCQTLGAPRRRPRNCQDRPPPPAPAACQVPLRFPPPI